MSGFSSDWLALRAAADGRARSQRLIGEAAATLEGPLAIVDLGSGTGASVAALSSRLPRPQRWRLCDHDAALLAEAARLAGEGVAIETVALDLSVEPAPWREPPDLVTASALFDLVAPAWIDTFADGLARAGAPLLAFLTYDGRLAPEPAHEDDAHLVDLFNRHQRGEKTFGRAAGPDAVALLRAALEQRGYEVLADDSAWHLERGRDDAMIAATLSGWREAACEIAPSEGDRIGRWHAARSSATDRLTVGHTDIFARPRA